jgi:hypothetical protein
MPALSAAWRGLIVPGLMAPGLAVLCVVAGVGSAQALEPSDPARAERAPVERAQVEQAPVEQAPIAELQLDAAERSRFQRPAEDPALAATPPAAEAAVAPPSPWAGTVELYGFLPLKTTNRTTIEGFTAQSDLSISQLLTALSSTFSLRGSVEHGRLGLLTDISYVNLQKQAAIESTRGRATERLAAREQGAGSVTRGLRTEVGTEQGLYDLALRYRLGPRENALAESGTVTVIPYAGLRIVDVGLSIDSILRSSRGRQRAVSRAYGTPGVQPLLGAQAQVFLAPRLRLFARGDAAGFGIDSADSFSANAQVGLGYAVGNSTQINLSWRYLTMAADNGRQRPSAYELIENGIELGLKFFF